MNNIKQIEVIYDNRLVGRLALTKEGLCAFEYSAEWLGTGFSISPFELPLKSGVFIAKRDPFEGGFGVFDDCLPDGWGLLILDRYLQQKGIIPRTLSLLDRLALVGSTGRGALEFRPDRSVVSQKDFADFEQLAVEAERILDSDDYSGESIMEFQYRGGAPGGARPKIFVRYDDKEWLVKFRAKRDPKRIGIEEYHYSLLAKKCRIEMPDTHLFEDKYFGVERFDRTKNGKLHVISVAGLIGADYRLPSIDYIHIFKACLALSRNMAEMWKVYRLMVFNVLIENKDDHAKNFSFIYRDEDWHLAPAYDLLPSDGIGGFRTTSINGSITPTKEDIFAVAVKVGLDKKEAIKIFEEMAGIIREQK
ncbi:type II toxin-antitoxin system HipA family toxin [Porphyromonas cangingivalis]|uniref:type II toxin-antitoxin system HipA family toxin n=1 Tax=Porphyromonas cangingivalis TaxID=36874 RepID=UPI00051DF23D|nr:type II toxin-antitoxin system HipA family toxin [Porphyromonas cangingivalis]KGL48315.1 HipA-like C-terminal domain protein [Porphyromonas cangingivalis]